MKEEWRSVIGYEGLYEISSLGNVRGLDRVIKWCECGRPLRRIKGKSVKWIMHKFGYPMVSLSRNNRYVQFMVHRLVLAAFVGPCPVGMEACHKNGKRDDPRPENLRWDTRKENHADKWRHGTMLVGERTNSVKLNRQQVLEIRGAPDCPVGELAKRYGVGRAAIERIRNRRTWVWLGNEAA